MIWDTAGQERFRAITKAYYRNSNAVMVVYDVTNRESFDHVDRWLKDIEENCNYEEKISKFLVGNRADEEKRHVTYAEGEQACRDKGFSGFLETSAKSGQNVNEIFSMIAKQIYLHSNPERAKKVSSFSNKCFCSIHRH